MVLWVVGLLYAAKTVFDISNNNFSFVDVVLTLMLLALALGYTLIWKHAKSEPAKASDKP